MAPRLAQSNNITQREKATRRENAIPDMYKLYTGNEDVPASSVRQRTFSASDETVNSTFKPNISIDANSLLAGLRHAQMEHFRNGGLYQKPT